MLLAALSGEHLLLLRQAPVCKACKLKIDPTCQQGAKVKDATYHRTCLICAGCDTPLKQVAEKEGHLLCKECLLKYVQTKLIRDMDPSELTKQIEGRALAVVHHTVT